MSGHHQYPHHIRFDQDQPQNSCSPPFLHPVPVFQSPAPHPAFQGTFPSPFPQAPPGLLPTPPHYGPPHYSHYGMASRYDPQPHSYGGFPNWHPPLVWPGGSGAAQAHREVHTYHGGPQQHYHGIATHLTESRPDPRSPSVSRVLQLYPVDDAPDADLFWTHTLSHFEKHEPSPTLIPDHPGDIKVLTWNILAPQYNRGQLVDCSSDFPLHILDANGTPKRLEFDNDSGRFEYEKPELYTKRLYGILKFLEKMIESGCSIIGLQEFWFAREFKEAFERAFGSRFSFHYLKRTHKKRDGLLTMVDSTRFIVEDPKAISLPGWGKRVALFLKIRPRDARCGAPLVFANTHLTYRSTPSHDAVRGQEVRSLLGALRGYSRGCPVMVVGDFNGHDDHVFHSMRREGFKCSYEESRQPIGVTHKTHDESCVWADYIFFRSPYEARSDRSRGIRFDSCELLPTGLDPKEWPSLEEWHLSDHRPLAANFRVFQ